MARALHTAASMAVRVDRIISIAILLALYGTAGVLAQSRSDITGDTGIDWRAPDIGDIARADPPPPPAIQLPATPSPADEGRACDGCPPRRLGSAFLWVTVVNGGYELANLIRGQDTAKITPETWWINMKRGWEWDLDDFGVNQIGHPYQGNNYFTTGRANGMNFWESAGLTAFGSGTWEYFGETNQASLNDFINTTLGGIALGEMFHRTAWLVRNTHATGRSRMWSEIGATALDPMSGLMRFMSGDAGRVVDKPADMVPASLTAVASVGTLWRGSNTEAVEPNTYGFFETDLLYGDVLKAEDSHTPYNAFAVRLSFGGGAAFSEARVRGRLYSKQLPRTLFTLAQAYQYNNNPAYRFGAQAFEGLFIGEKRLTSNLSLVALGGGGVTVLGAVDSIPLTGIVPEEPDPDAGQGVSTGPRYYDYGPGGNLVANFILNRGTHQFVNFGYELHHLHVLDGVRANHVLQRARLDVTWPLRGSLGIGGSTEFFSRRTYYADDAGEANYHFPQYRIFLTWTL